MNSMPSPEPTGLARVLAAERVRPVAMACFLLSLLLALGWQGSYFILLARLFLVGLGCLLAFGVFERWPRRLPRWMARWALQVAGVAFVIPFVTAIAYGLTTFG